MKSKLHLRRQDDRPDYTTEVEIEVTDQEVTGLSIITKGRYNADRFPQPGWTVKGDLKNWCSYHPKRQVKLPNEPESAYRHIENISQLGDALGCGRVG